MREVAIDVPCPLSAKQLWYLRSQLTFDEFNAKLDKRTVKIEREETLDDGKRLKELSSTLIENPVPRALRHVVDASLVAPNMTTEWYTDKWDEDHACSFRVDTPAFADKVSITGRQWLTEQGSNRCIVSTRISIDCRVPGLGSVVERLVDDGMRKSYGSYEKRIPAYFKQHPSVAASLPVVEACEQACQTDSPTRSKTKRVSWFPGFVSGHSRLKEESIPESDFEVTELGPPCGLCANGIGSCCRSIFRYICRYKRVSGQKADTDMPMAPALPFDAELSRKCNELGIVD
jgi:hypothetical protein